MGKRAAQTKGVKDCAWPAPRGIKGRGAQGGGPEAGPSVLGTPLRRPGRMRLAVRALLACAVLGECGRWEGPQSRRPGCPLNTGARHTIPGLRAGAGSPDLSFASPRCTLASASSLSQGQLCACAHLLVLPVPLPHFHPFLASSSCPENLVVAKHNKLEHFHHGLSNPFAAVSIKSKLLRMAFKASPDLVPPPLIV